MQNVLTYGVGSIQLVFHVHLHVYNTCKGVFNPNVTSVVESLHCKALPVGETVVLHFIQIAPRVCTLVLFILHINGPNTP